MCFVRSLRTVRGHLRRIPDRSCSPYERKEKQDCSLHSQPQNWLTEQRTTIKSTFPKSQIDFRSSKISRMITGKFCCRKLKFYSIISQQEHACNMFDGHSRLIGQFKFSPRANNSVVKSEAFNARESFHMLNHTFDFHSLKVSMTVQLFTTARANWILC